MSTPDFQNYTLPQLTEWHNAHAHKPRKSFRSRAEAVRQCELLADAMRFDAPLESAEQSPVTTEAIKSAVEEALQDEEIQKALQEALDEAVREFKEELRQQRKAPKRAAEGEVDPDRSASIAESWQDPEIRAKRVARYPILHVQTGKVYRSMTAAFEALGLDMRKSARMRRKCIDDGELEFQGHTFRLAEQ